MMISKAMDVVEVPFPFSDIPHAKRRKALVLSSSAFNESNQTTILMMLTSADRSTWLLDTPIEHRDVAGLHKPCVARMKIFTLDNNLILRHSGHLHANDVQNVKAALGQALTMA